MTPTNPDPTYAPTPFAGTFADDADTLARLHSRLAASADDEGLLDVAYRLVDTPVGSLLLAATEQGLVRVAYVAEGQDEVLQQLVDRISPRVLLAPARLELAARQLDEYFARHRVRFDVPLDLRLSAGFRRQVLGTLRELDHGTTASYASVAASTGSPNAVRAVGTACATNPLPVVIPCHRVIRTDGSLGGYVGGTAAKQTLLELEAA